MTLTVLYRVRNAFVNGFWQVEPMAYVEKFGTDSPAVSGVVYSFCTEGEVSEHSMLRWSNVILQSIDILNEPCIKPG